MITHIVFFRLKDTSPSGIETTRQVLLNMQGRIEQLQHLEVGEDLLHQARSYDLALITKFHSLEDLDAYQVHPVHQKVVEHMKEVLREPSVCVDFESAG
ncbi:Dabb family protein [Paenibacillus sp. CC-CFT747]|nr:Dabb family protein [Paenibacillus sp. CC-CFT747]